MIVSGTEREIIEKLIAGERTATIQAVGWIREVIQHHGWGNRLDRDELLQETYLALIRNLREERYRATGGGLKSYVQSITRIQCLRALRRSYQRQEVDIDALTTLSPNPGPDELIEMEERRKSGLKILRALKRDCRKLLIWKYVHQLPSSVIGERLGITEGAVRVRLHRCMRTILHQIGMIDR